MILLGILAMQLAGFYFRVVIYFISSKESES